MSKNNVIYFKTSNLYDDRNAIRMEVDYEKGKGYKVDIDPCKVEEHGFSTILSNDYFKYSCKFPIESLETTRRSKGKESKAIEYMNDNTDKILKDYCKLCLERDGGEIKVLWEYSHHVLKDKIRNELPNRIRDLVAVTENNSPMQNQAISVCNKIAEFIEEKSNTFTPYELGELISKEDTFNYLFESWENNDDISMFSEIYKTLDDMFENFGSNTNFEGALVPSDELDLGYSQ